MYTFMGLRCLCVKLQVFEDMLELQISTFYSRETSKMFLSLLETIIIITVSNNDRPVSGFRCTPGLKYAVGLPSSHSCRFFHSGRRPTKLYIFGKLSMSTFQKYIVLSVFDSSERIYSWLETCILGKGVARRSLSLLETVIYSFIFLMRCYMKFLAEMKPK